jgi:hypothetical protein
VSPEASSTFINNMKLPVHRWFRFSAGFSAQWVETVIRETALPRVRLFDPFSGSATSLIAAETVGVESWGIDAHPFVSRIAGAKLEWRSDPDAYVSKMVILKRAAAGLKPCVEGYPPLIYKCYDEKSLATLDVLRQAYEKIQDGTPVSRLVWLTLVSILRKVSKAGTAQWQYVLPKKSKRSTPEVNRALDDCCQMFYEDMLLGRTLHGPRAHFIQSDALTCRGVPRAWANLVITSPPYPNNYDYADATRLEMSFMREISGWSDLQGTVRKHLLRSCSQHVPEGSVDLSATLSLPELEPIRSELSEVCDKLAEVRLDRGGRKTYHLMIAGYFHDLALAWKALRGVCDSPAKVCFVIGDSAPYGVYVPVVPWMSKLAMAAGFHSCRFEKTRDRNLKWKNRKHRVPLLEGRLWAEG